jgi:hypothetical protein
VPLATRTTRPVRRRHGLSLLAVPLLAVHALAQGPNLPSASAPTVSIVLDRSIVALNGPWKFHTGDDPRWAAPRFDDLAWENVDLTPPAGAHDGDVGLSGYVPGWTARGHVGYSGYAWYRMTVSVAAPSEQPLALTGPPDVDDAYQLFVNGRLVGSAGDFTGPVPVVYSVQPRIILLPPSLVPMSPDGKRSIVLAFRVWMSAGDVGAAPDVGGIHIAPALGIRSTIAAQYQLQWLETVRGYVLEVIEPILFVLLAIMACSLIAFDPSDTAYLWLSAALVLTGLVRANQALFFWGQYESVHAFDIATSVILVPLGLGAWTMAWRAWFRLPRPRWIPRAVLAMTVLYIASQLLSRSWMASTVPHPIGAVFHTISSCLRVLFALLLILVGYGSFRLPIRDRWLALTALPLVSVGLFAQELSELHVPGIWFPFGTGVSRAQFAYPAFDVIMFTLLWRRLHVFASSSHRPQPEPVDQLAQEQ